MSMWHPNKIIVILLINIITLTSTFKLQQLPLWTWNCIDNKCVPTKANHVDKLQSLVTCNMLCTSLHLWPLPTGMVTLSTTAVPVHAKYFNLKILSFPSLPVRDHCSKAFDLFKQDLLKMENSTSGNEAWHTVEIRVAINESGSGNPRMLFNTDESYQLQLYPKKLSDRYLIVNVTSNSFCGLRHALETLSQLVWLDPYRGCLLMMNSADIEDSPRFPYRGLMLDTVQNYFPVNEIIRTLDVMSASKLNTFHWHAMDAQGFSINLNSLSEFVQYEWYAQGAMYSPDEVRMIAKYAHIRGIRVLLEFDLPAFICEQASLLEPEMRFNGLAQGVDPSNIYKSEFVCKKNTSHIYNTIEKIYDEIIKLTGEEDIFHLGGNVISEHCWNESLNTTTAIDSRLQLFRNILQHLESVNKKLPNLTVLWSTHLSDRIKIDLKTYVHRLGIQIRNVPWTQKHITGLRTIISHEDAWDLNSGYGEWYEDSNGAPFNSWQRVYEHRPWNWKSMTCLEGGEATLWSSTVGAGGLEARVWPRVAALGERLWSDHAEGATQLVQARLDVHRSRLRVRGIHTAPLWSMWCTHNTFTC